MKKNVSIWSDIIRSWFFLLILFVSMIPQIFEGYSVYLMVLVIPVIFYKMKVKLDSVFVLSLFFGFLYAIPQIFQQPPLPFSKQIFYFFYPALMYVAGQYVVYSEKNKNTPIIVLCLITFCLASWSITTNIYDTLKTGELVNMSRYLEGEGEKSRATIHNMMLAMGIMGIGALFLSTDRKSEKLIKCLMVIVGGMALFSGLHILNRTAAVLGAAAVVIGILYNGFSAKKLIVLTLILVVLGFIYVYALENSELLRGLTAGFRSREDFSSRFSASSVGGRTFMWEKAIDFIPDHPFGGDSMERIGWTFAHNVWLDVCVRSGWIPFIIFIVLTYFFVSQLYQFLYRSSADHFSKGCIILWTAGMILQFLVEPVTEAVFQLFLMFFFLLGWFTRYNIKYPKKILRRPVHTEPKIKLAKV